MSGIVVNLFAKLTVLTKEYPGHIFCEFIAIFGAFKNYNYSITPAQSDSLEK